MSVASSTAFDTLNNNGIMNWEPIRKSILHADLKDGMKTVTELRERIEIVHTTEFPAMLSALLPAFSSVLSHCTRPNPDKTSVEHKFRNAVLELLSRLPNNEVLRPHTPHMLATAMDVLTRDYEDNAFLASRIIFDLHKNYRPMHQDQVQPFLDFVQHVYRSLPTSVQRNFLFPTETTVPMSVDLPSLSTPSKPKLDTHSTPTKQDMTSSSHQLDTSTLKTPPKTPVPKLALKSSSSFRVLTECPLTTMLIFQLYPKFLATNISTMINLMVEALALRATPIQSIDGGKLSSQDQRLYFSRSQQLLAGQSKTLSFLTYLLRGFSDQMKPYEDRIASNIVALMTTCPRDAITIRKELLVSTRHILATDFRKGFFRHVDSLLDERVLMGTSPIHHHHHSHRHHHNTNPSLIRPLGYSTLADFVHHVRSLLTMPQLSRVVYMFSRVLHDPSMKQLPMSIQITAVRLLLNVVDIVFHNKDPNPQLGRDLLVRILDALVNKLGTIKDDLSLRDSKEVKTMTNSKDSVKKMADTDKEGINDETGEIEGGYDKEAKKGSKVNEEDASKITVGSSNSGIVSEFSEIKIIPLSRSLFLNDIEVTDSIGDLQSIVKSIVVGLKTVIWCINNYRHQREKIKSREQVPSTTPATIGNEEVASAMQKMTHWERDLVDKYIVFALPCLNVFIDNDEKNHSCISSHTTKLSPSTEKYRDVLGYFSAAFSVLDGSNLRQTLGNRINLLFEAIVDDPHVMVIPRHLLVSNQATSFDFCDVLLSFLVQKMSALSTSRSKEFSFVASPSHSDITGKERTHQDLLKGRLRDSDEGSDLLDRTATAVLQLFERVLKSLSSFSENEAALRPHLQKIVATCLRSSMESIDLWPGNYFILLRFVFRSISAGKFEESYRELLPLIPTILNGLYRIYEATEDSNLRHAIIELCLTIPARLSSLLPHMSLLLRVIIPALRSNKGDLVNLGLRTLEFWVDNLNPEFLYPILSKQGDFFTELMTALSLHLRPAPYPYGLLTLRLLGKLGGKNRRFLREPLDLGARSVDVPLLSIECRWSLSRDIKCTEVSSGKSTSTNIEETYNTDSKVEAGENIDSTGVTFALPLPLDRAVEILKIVALSQREVNEGQRMLSDRTSSTSLERVRWRDFEKVWSAKIEKVDLTAYCRDVTDQTKQHQADAAFTVVCSSLAAVTEIGESDIEAITVHEMGMTERRDSNVDTLPVGDSVEGLSYPPGCTLSATSCIAEARNSRLQQIVSGLMFASVLQSSGIEARMLLKGFVTHIFLIVMSHQSHILRIDANGSVIEPNDYDEELAPVGDLTAKEDNAADKNASIEIPATQDYAGCVRKSQNPFGYFKMTGPLHSKANPFVLNQSIAEFLCERNATAQVVGLDLIVHLLELSRTISIEGGNVTVLSPTASSETIVENQILGYGCDIYFENLLSRLCHVCLSRPWNTRIGAFNGICKLMDGLGPKWSLSYETELMHVAVTCVKSAPREAGTAAVTAFQFFSRVCLALYEGPEDWSATKEPIIVHDVLSASGKTQISAKNVQTHKNEARTKEGEQGVEKTVKNDSEKKHLVDKKVDERKGGSVHNSETKKKEDGPVQMEAGGQGEGEGEGEGEGDEKGDTRKNGDPQKENPTEENKEYPSQNQEKASRVSPNDAVVQMLFSEMASPKQIMRFAVRFAMQNFVMHTLSSSFDREKLVSTHASTVKRALFSRSLRLLPLPEQVGVVEALAFIIGEVPGIIPISDQHLLAFLSELLKMSSIADGEMSDPNLAGLAVDKNGYAISPQHQDTTATEKLSSLTHASVAFLRKECILHTDSIGIDIVIPEELPHGVQLRVSSLKLFNAVIKRHPDDFFDADSSTPIGNVRPHVISLLFRSLVSTPPQAVAASHEALRDVLSLSILTRDAAEGAKSQSRLPKELLQTCIRPVLLNLKEYTRLTVPLLRGLSRLLSLLSTWFNRTLGEKLLDHLQKWTDPDRIIARQIWRQGEEPVVAAAIIDLFALLPHASQFVEALVKTTIKLEAALPRFKTRQVRSPYRSPLARYLNKYCQFAISFFFPRLRNPMYSELFQAIVRIDESGPLREYLSGRQCSVTLLNVCFERPLAIIRSEKTSSANNSIPSGAKSPGIPQRSAADILSMHGIISEATVSGSNQVVALKRDIESKQKKVQALQQDVSRTKEVLQKRAASVALGAPSDSQAMIEDMKRQHQSAQNTYEKGLQSLNESKQRFAAEVAQTTSKASKAVEGGANVNTRPMSIDALELQHQGFILVETLVEKDAKYLQNHNDVVRAFRWLWRSKGRHLRLQYEEAMSPRFHNESKMLASFLVNYARVFPNDVDVLFELIRIFLQPTTTDFAFVQRFLTHTVSTVLQIDRKKHVMQRFFALVAGEGSEETKALSIQLIVLPMLSGPSHLKSQKVSESLITRVKQQKMAHNACSDVLDSTMIWKFVKEVLFRDGSPTPCGERFKIELLKLSTLLLEKIPKDVTDFRSDLIKFPWSLLKNEHSNIKHWAYINVCRFVSVFEIPAKIILQVYLALLRSHQPEGKELIRTALGILVPSLKKRLSGEEYKKAIDLTNKIMYEEGNAVPQLAHIWYIIVRHPDIFYSYCHRFARHMINSVHRLGLPPNCPQENRALTLDIIELLLRWEERQLRDSVVSVNEDKQSEREKRHISSGEAINSSPSKKLKNNEGASVPPIAKFQSDHDEVTEELFILDQNMINTIANFLVRLKLLIADSKAEGAQQDLADRTTALFKRIVFKWGKCTIRAVYFEKVVTMCLAETMASTTKSTESKPDTVDKKGKDKSKSKASGGKPGNKGGKLVSTKSASISTLHAKQKDDSRTVSLALLSACLDIFVILAEEAPQNSFLEDNSSKVNAILGPCFSRAGNRDGETIRRKLKNLLIPLFSCKQRVYDPEIMLRITVFIEKFIIEAANPDLATDGVNTTEGSISETTKEDDQQRRHITSHSGDKRAEGSILALFSIDIIEEVCKSKPKFVEKFASCIVSLAAVLAERHIQEASSNQRPNSSSPHKAGSCEFEHMHVTPIAGIMEEACSDDHLQTVVSGNSKSTVVNDDSRSRDIPDLGSASRSLVVCLRLIGSSSVPLTFGHQRRTYFKVLGSIIDKSDNVQVLMIAVSIVGKWLVAYDCNGPMTLKERNSFLWKIASFDFNGLSDVIAQPLADLVACVVLAMHTGRKQCVNFDMPTASFCETKGSSTVVNEDAKGSDKAQSKTCDGDAVLFERSLVACLLNANPSVRSKILGIYGTHGEKSSSPKVDCESDGVAVMGIPGRSPVDALWQLFHSDFEGLGGRLWILVFVELLLAICEPNHGIRLASKELLGLDGANVLTTIQLKGESTAWLPPPASDKAPPTTCTSNSGIASNYLSFCRKVSEEKSSSRTGCGRCLGAVRVLAHGDAMLCQTLFNTLLPVAWNSLPSDSTRSKLVPAMESLLSRSFHSQFFKPSCLSSTGCYLRERHEQNQDAMNVIRACLRSIAELRPMPALDTNLFLSLAENYNCWHEVISILEHQHQVVSTMSTTGDHIRSFAENLLSAIRHCYWQLGEVNVWLGLSAKSCQLPESRWAISLDVHDMVKESLDAYSGLVELVSDGEKSKDIFPSDFEMSLWEDRWVELQKEMCQWQVVSEYADSSGSPHLLLETAWKSQNWEKVRGLCSAPALIASVEAGDPTIKLSEIFLAIVEGKLSDVENLHAQTAQLCLHKWQLLPMISSGNAVHVSLLQLFHRLVELRESGQIMVETSNHSSGRTLPDLKNLLSAWRYRLPNEFENISVWDNLFLWRSHMFTAITSNFHWSEPNALASLHDRPWTAIRMAKTARKQGMREVAMLSLSKLTDCAMDVSDAFSKLREQILVYNNSKSELERTGGLNLVNTTNLSFFDSSQKSELFRLKALFLSSLGGRSKANQAYCHSVQICPSYARAWVSWGGLCSSLGDITEKQREHQASTGSDTGANAAAAAAKKVAQYLAQGMGCYIEAVQCNSHEWSRIHLPKCLWMLIKDGSTPGVLCQTLETRGAALPSWVWLPWIPQLLTSLCRVEGRAAKAILTGLVKSYPQALYFALRAFYLERRDVDRSRGPSSASNNNQGSVAHAEELMSSLRRAHPTLWTSLEAILEELIVRFRPSYEEELLATITALLDRAESQINHHKYSDKGETDEKDAILASVSKTLGRISTKFFSANQSDSGPKKRDERTKKTDEFKRKYKPAFESDFAIGGAASVESKAKLSLTEFLSRLKKWKGRLEAQVSSTPDSLPLIESSTTLALFSSEAPDLWAGSCDPRQSDSPSLDRERSRETEETLNPSSTSSSAAAATVAAASAALAVANVASVEGVGGHYGGGSAAIEIPGQYVPNRSNAQDSKPNPELHSKLIRFESKLQVLRRNEHLVRRIGMVGSDGKTYRFLLQFAIPYWTRTDERTSQLHYLVDKLLRRSIMSSRNYLSAQPSAVIPIAQRLRMTAEEDTRLSLDDAYRELCEREGRKFDDISNYFMEEVSRNLEERKYGEMKGSERKKTETAAKLQVFQQICEKKVDGSILLKKMHSVLDGPERLYQFRRSFSGQLAANSLLQYAFSVVERNPSRVVFDQKNGRIMAPDFRFAYSNQGFLEGNDLPFRMTPNIESLVGPHLLEGRFIPSMATVATAVTDQKDDIDSIFRLILRDDIVAWYTSKSTAKSDTKTQELEKQLSDRVVKNVSLVQARFAECNPIRKIEKGKLGQEPVDMKVRKLLEEATNAENLCMMPTSYQGWL